MSKFISTLSIVAAVAASVISVYADVKIKSKQTISGQSYENTTFIKGKRQRSEAMNGMMINITQCDLRRGVQINTTTQTYVINPFQNAADARSAVAGQTSEGGPVRSGGIVTTTITTKDTGERKQMFGYTARHLIITMESVSSPDSCSKNNTKMVTDGWYIDFETQFDCGDVSSFSSYNNYKKSGCQDKYSIKTIGTAKRGYAVYEKMSMFDETGKETMSMVNEVVELSKTTLDAALFDIPEGYREVTDASQMYAASSRPKVGPENSTGSANSMKLPNVSVQAKRGDSSSLNVADAGLASPGVGSSSVGNKQEGTVRIGLSMVKTGTVGDSISASDLSTAVQNTLAEYLKLPNVEVVRLEGRLTSSIEADARQKECDFVVYLTVSHKKGSGGFGGMFGSALGSAIGRTGIGQTGSTIGNIAGQVATQTIVTATSLSANVRSKDELSADLRLIRADGSSALTRAFKVKARSNGDDIVSALVEQAAQAIADAIAK